MLFAEEMGMIFMVTDCALSSQKEAPGIAADPFPCLRGVLETAEQAGESSLKAFQCPPAGKI